MNGARINGLDEDETGFRLADDGQALQFHDGAVAGDMYVQVFHEAGEALPVRTPENSCLAKSTALSMDSSVSNNNVSASMMMVGAKCCLLYTSRCV